MQDWEGGGEEAPINGISVGKGGNIRAVMSFRFRSA